MPGRRRARFWIASVLGLAVVVGAAIGGVHRYRGGTARPVVVDYGSGTPMKVLAEGLRQGDTRALAVLYQRLGDPAKTPRTALTDAEAADAIAALEGLRAGFLRFSGYGRGLSMMTATQVLDRFAIEEAPARWTQALPPVHDLVCSGLADPDLDVQVAALREVGRLWSWLPGCSLMHVADGALAAWKQGLHGPVIRCLADPLRGGRAEGEASARDGAADDGAAKVRAAAVACLGLLPIDAAAVPAVAYLEDPHPAVRQQVIVSFAGRRDLLTEDDLLKRLHDQEPAIRESAEIVLTTRGLTADQIGLGKQIFSPKPELRASVIPLLGKRTDIDPMVWLLQLSHDPVESVRIAAAEAMAELFTPEARQRLSEMAETDPSPAVRQAVNQLETAALPPLPGSTNLNPKAN